MSLADYARSIMSRADHYVVISLDSFRPETIREWI